MVTKSLSGGLQTQTQLYSFLIWRQAFDFRTIQSSEGPRNGGVSCAVPFLLQFFSSSQESSFVMWEEEDSLESLAPHATLKKGTGTTKVRMVENQNGKRAGGPDAKTHPHPGTLEVPSAAVIPNVSSVSWCEWRRYSISNLSCLFSFCMHTAIPGP
jgi:hypothetical protein